MLYVYNLIALLHSRIDSAKDRGATATEYAVLVAFIALIITVGVSFFGHTLSDWFHSLATNIGLTGGS